MATSAATTAFSAVDTGILLEAGTNEAEILIFRVGDQRFGVNVAKVREVLPIETVTPIPESHEAIDGLVTIRELIVPMVNLEKYFHIVDTSGDSSEESLLLLEFNRQHIAFRVRAVKRIFRITWKDTLPAPQLGGDASAITSVWRLDSALVPLIDFEAISAKIGISGKTSMVGSVIPDDSVQISDVPICYADDSAMISEMVKDSLIDAGFRKLKGFRDGDEFWQYLDDLSKTLSAEEVREKVACIVTDVEMPRMDGLSLTKKIRQNPATTGIPVIVFSSIASEDNEKKGIQVGATAQIAKPRYDELVNQVVELVG